MKKRVKLLFFLLLILLISPVLSQTRNRADIPDKYKWDLADLYPSEEAYQKAKEETVKKFDGLADFKGKLTESPLKLLEGLDYFYSIHFIK